MSTVSLKVEFSGGLELLFNNQRQIKLDLPAQVPSDSQTVVAAGGQADASEGRPADVRYLIHWLKDNRLKERPELFVENGTVRPGILVLINDTDWELEGEEEYVLENGDDIVFISTLHGG
ncbi:ubiquitin-related modifier 1 [Sistotremastrum suecicum HHB10207 ss-3]|uniref:Ubiquitin-related modifier 1 n=1 Tax=Sistotremastrum suecicum HHB10207 ss-3 TaxID=1314776 RepID=A0A166I4Q1_9AGAM|nr:ubiquitin-related modifier 1 [Sistotremastrum suecicum HHB10207 ss-3]